MSQEPEPGDIGGGGNPVPAQGGTRPFVKCAHDLDGFVRESRRALPPFDRGGDDPHPQRLGQDQVVIGHRPDIGVDVIDPGGAGDGEPVGRLGPIDGMPTDDGAAGFDHDVHASRDHLRRHIEGELVPGPCQILKGCERSGSHGIEIREGVGSSDTAPIPGRVHHRSEDVHGLDEGASIPQRIHAGVVAGSQADDQVGMGSCGVIMHGAQDLGQLGGAEFAGSAGPMAVSAETDFCHPAEVKRSTGMPLLSMRRATGPAGGAAVHTQSPTPPNGSASSSCSVSLATCSGRTETANPE